MDCLNKKKNDSICNCSYPGCPRRGVCCECLVYHRSNDELPACYFDKEAERTCDRSIGHFIKIILVIFLFFPVFAHADIIHLQSHHNVNRGKFASPDGIFNSKLKIVSIGKFATEGLFSSKTIPKNSRSGKFKNFTGVFNQNSNKFRFLNSVSKAPHGEFSSDRLISGEGRSLIGKNSFKSPDQSDFKFSLPK